MRLESLTTQLQEALQDANSLVVVNEQQLIEPAHIVEALIRMQGSSIPAILTLCGADANAVKILLDEEIKKFKQLMK